MRSRVISNLGLILLAFPSISIAATQCYFNDGTEAPGYSACNSNQSGNSHSACCNLGNPQRGRADVCLTSGLCFWQQSTSSNGFLFANGCTDPTGQDPSCQQLCTGRNATVYTVVACPEGKWCCSTLLAANATANCCNNSFSLPAGALLAQTATLPSPPSTTTPPGISSSAGAPAITSNASQSSTSTPIATCPADKSTVVGASVGAVLGASLLAALVAIVFLLRKVRHLTRAAIAAQGLGRFDDPKTTSSRGLGGSTTYNHNTYNITGGNAAFEIDGSQRMNGVSELPVNNFNGQDHDRGYAL
ncbi:hypothetical protein TWF694_008040 [Orbilia ellipsospora]|uniref:Mid2 domain-containing protein n=1 Tax=Orbilia ellipsospora TaxID=2528407 RepID=A0AAV9XFV6_9PEZI